jgi:micrococcal nuclease
MRWVVAPAALIAGGVLLILLSLHDGGQTVTLSRSAPLPSASPAPPSLAPPPSTPAPHGVHVLHVTDGDTIILEDGRRVRYIGIDTPEMSDPRLREAAETARAANERLVGGKTVRLEMDREPLDRYGRTLAYVWVNDVLVNEVLLRDGFARLLTIPPNVKYIEHFRAAAGAGHGARTEIWRGGSTTRASGSSPPCSADSPVKGNISQQGEKIYHVSGGDFYDRTVPEDCFATAAAAEAAGYRASRR